MPSLSGDIEQLVNCCASLVKADLSIPDALSTLIEKAREMGLSEEFGRRLMGLLLEEKFREREEDGSGLALRQFAAKAREMQLSGKTVYRLELGEPDFGAPESAIQAAYNALRKGLSRYGPAIGIKELRQAIVEKLSHRFGLDLKIDNVAIVAGGTFASYASIEALSKQGDEVVVIEPAWPLYAHQARHLGRRVLKIKTRFEEDWDPIEQLQEKTTRLTKAVILNYPNNPTGKIANERLFRGVIEIAEDVDAWIVSDEVYIDFCYDDEAKSALQFASNRVLMFNSFSKTWGMTGFRVGYMVSDLDTVKKVAAIQNAAMTCIPEFVQRAALAALEDEEVARENVEKIGQRLRILYEELSKSDLLEVNKPQGAMYLFPKIKIENFDPWKFAEKLLEEKGVSIAPGVCFGDYPNNIRISAVLDEKPLREACRRIRDGLEDYCRRVGAR